MARVGLSFSDRSEISTASKAGWSVRRIARHLGRCPS
ncbi:helix-turn-helix domain-containing protein, partial [Propionibacterium freudenreichii]